MSSNTPSDLTPQYLSEWDGRPVITTAIVFIVLNTIFVFFRFLSRYLQRATYGWDDVLMVPSWLLTIAISIVSIGESEERHLFERNQSMKSTVYLQVVSSGCFRIRRRSSYRISGNASRLDSKTWNDRSLRESNALFGSGRFSKAVYPCPLPSHLHR